jgi:uncharacterized membrane protein (DUF106 family)
MKHTNKQYKKIQNLKEDFHNKHRKPFSYSFFIALLIFVALFIMYINGYLL